MDADTSSAHPIVYVVDDDQAVGQALAFALDLEGFRTELFQTAESLLLRDLVPRDGFLLIDERLPGISGQEMLRQLRARGVRLPAAFVTSHPKPSLRAIASAAGVPILEKPLLGETLIAAVRKGLAEQPA
jgi:FixJ family two-component response regulator